MSYGVKWRLEYTDELGRDKRVDILKKDYTGDIQEVTGATHSPVHISMQNQGDEKFETMKGTEIEVKLFSEIQFSGSFSDFSDDTFYVLDRQGSDEVYIRKCNIDLSTGISVSASWRFPTNAEQAGIANALDDETQLSVLRNGNVVAWASSAGSTNDEIDCLFLLDSDLNFIRSVILSKPNFPYIGFPYFAVDYDDSIYINHFRSDGNAVELRKYSSDLTSLLWTYTYSDSLTSFQQLGLNATRKYILFAFGVSAIGRVQAINRNTGEFVKEITGNKFRSSSAGNAIIGNYENGNIYIASSDDNTGTDYITIYDKEINELQEKITSENITQNRKINGTNKDESLNLSNTSEDFLNYDNSLNLLWESSSIGSGSLGRIGWTNSPNEVFLHRSTGSFTGSLYLVNISDQSITLVDDYSSAGIKPLSPLGFAMKSENWQLSAEFEIDFSEIAEGSDTDYKIEVYEDDGL